MQKTDYLIVGGGIAGTSAAREIRKNDPSGNITIISDEPYPLYSRVMLSKPSIVLGRFPIEKVFLRNNTWYKEKNITLIKGKRATGLETNKKIITLDDGSNWQYKKLLLAIGTYTRTWGVEGNKKEGVVYVRTLDDVKNIIRLLPRVRSAVTIGSGFISFEMCDILRKANIKVTEVMLEPYYWYPILDKSSAHYIEKVLTDNGVVIIHEQAIKEVRGDKKVEGVTLENGKAINCDMIVCGIGVICPYQWLKSSGVKLNHGVMADEYLKTNLSDVWVAGDAAEYKDILMEERFQLGNWTNAQMQGKTAGYNMVTDKPKPFSYVSAYNSTGFGIVISFIGNVRPFPDIKTVKRVFSHTPSYELLRIKNNRIVGAILINRAADIAPLSRIITQKIDVSSYAKKLSNQTFDLRMLI